MLLMASSLFMRSVTGAVRGVLTLALAWAIAGCTADRAAAQGRSGPAPAVSPGKLAARPLYRDPPFDHPTDPVFTYNAETRKWFMYYTQRRGGGIALIHGSKIGMATSEDNGATWKYLGTADITYGQDQHPTDYTYWAPEVIWGADKYHMYLSYVPGIFTDWNHPREIVQDRKSTRLNSSHANISYAVFCL